MQLIPDFLFCSKPLSNNRHGIVLDAQAEQVNNFRFIFKYIRGKYTVKVT
jgi:hypothetical protein